MWWRNKRQRFLKKWIICSFRDFYTLSLFCLSLLHYLCLFFLLSGQLTPSHLPIPPLLFVTSWWPSTRPSVSAVAQRGRWTSGSRPSSDASTGNAWQTGRSSRHLNPKWWVMAWVCERLWIQMFRYVQLDFQSYYIYHDIVHFLENKLRRYYINIIKLS